MARNYSKRQSVEQFWYLFVFQNIAAPPMTKSIIHTLGMYDKIHPAVSQTTSFSSGFYDIHFINHFSSDMCLVRHNMRTEPMKTEGSTHLLGGHLSDETGFHSDLTDIFDSEIIVKADFVHISSVVSSLRNLHLTKRRETGHH
nr:unnamed protein product [Callosobruchus chinensis]